jgi:hypothetical protein
MSSTAEGTTPGVKKNLGTVNMAQSKMILKTVALSKPRRPAIIRGRHAIGKSYSVYQMAKELAPLFGLDELPVVERRAAQMTEGDLLGIPDPEGTMVEPHGLDIEGREAIKASKFNPPDWYARAMQGPCILFFDEIDRAVIEVRQGIFELCDSRKLWGNHLHEDTIIVAAVNGGLHAAHYIGVRDLDRAELSRYYVIDLEPTVEEWFAWAKDKIHVSLIDFLRKFPGHLEHIGAFPSTTKVYPDRRAWEWFNAALVANGVFDSKKIDMDLISLLATARVGLEASQALVSFLGNYKFQIKPEEIFVEGNFDLLEGWEMNDYVSFMHIAETFLLDEMDENVAQNMATYLVDYVPAELSAVLFTLTIKQRFENMLMIAKNNKALSDKIAEALRDQHAAKIANLDKNGDS